MSDAQRMLVGRIDNQGDRVLLYKDTEPTLSRFGEYHIIAPAGCSVCVGDVVEYEPYGSNFGWFVDNTPPAHDGGESEAT